MKNLATLLLLAVLLAVAPAPAQQATETKNLRTRERMLPPGVAEERYRTEKGLRPGRFSSPPEDGKGVPGRRRPTDRRRELWRKEMPATHAPGQDRLLSGMNERAPKGFAGGLAQRHSFSGSVDTAWVRHYGSGLVASDDQVAALVLDAVGNVYVTGTSSGDYATIKYNPAGEQQWLARYNGPGNGDDEATALALDAAGNVYVTGGSVGSGTNYDYAIIKYNPAGEQQWLARYNGPGNDWDYATALALDAAGNVYVTGESSGDYVTIKYNPAGEQQWLARYNGPENGDDKANALALDAAGNVYVTGWSYDSGTGYDYATTKYNTAGEQQWLARYNGPGNSSDGATALALDAAGNVYVTGGSSGSGTGGDYATIRYNPAGEQQWVARYNGPEYGSDYTTALTLDIAGNVYVTGLSSGLGTGYDYATIKYNPAGEQQWLARYNGPGNGDDEATALALDAAGNVYVTGGSVGSGTGFDYATIKYNSAGEPKWLARYNGPGSDGDGATALVLDAAGNVYVTGLSYGSDTGGDYATIKYNHAGEQQWLARYNSPGNSWDEATDLALDAAGNVYVTGSSLVSGTGYDYVTIKYNSAGEPQWLARYNGPGNGDDEATALALDDAGNVYVTGYSSGSGTGSDYATIKYNSAGEQQWVARHNGPENSYDEPTALALDAAGNVYVAGSSNSRSGPIGHYTTIKYNTAGKQQWVASYWGQGTFFNEATALAPDAAGNVYVTGYSSGSGTGYDYATIKYNLLGEQQWVARYNGPGNDWDYATALALDAAGNVYVTGYSSGSGTGSDYATIKYNSAGEPQWLARYNGPGNHWDVTTDLALDAAGNVYVTGYSLGSGSDFDYATVKYNPAGEQQWLVRYNGPGNNWDEAAALALDAAGNVYVTGYSAVTSNSRMYTTIKYVQDAPVNPIIHVNTPAAGITWWVGTKDTVTWSSSNVTGNVNIKLSIDGGSTFPITLAANTANDSSESITVPDNPSNTCRIRVESVSDPSVFGHNPGNFTIAHKPVITVKDPVGGDEWLADSARTVRWTSSDVTGNVNIKLSIDGGTTFPITLADDIANDGSESITVPNHPSDSCRIRVESVSDPSVFGDNHGNFTIDRGVGISESQATLPQAHHLKQNFPNPFNPGTAITFTLPKTGEVTLTIYSTAGQLIKQVASGRFAAGEHQVNWDGRNAAGEQVAAGIYLYRLVVRDAAGAVTFTETKRMALLK